MIDGTCTYKMGINKLLAFIADYKSLMKMHDIYFT